VTFPPASGDTERAFYRQAGPGVLEISWSLGKSLGLRAILRASQRLDDVCGALRADLAHAALADQRLQLVTLERHLASWATFPQPRLVRHVSDPPANRRGFGDLRGAGSGGAFQIGICEAPLRVSYGCPGSWRTPSRGRLGHGWITRVPRPAAGYTGIWDRSTRVYQSCFSWYWRSAAFGTELRTTNAAREAAELIIALAQRPVRRNAD